MAVLGRILQVVGWLWVLAGFFGNFINLPVGNIVPGIILLFVSRLIRVQAARQERAETLEEATVSEMAPPEARVRRVPSMRPPPEPTARAERPTEPSPVPARSESVGFPQDALEKILLTGEPREDDWESTEVDIPVETAEGVLRLSSSEMIARARQRWDRRP